MPIAEVNFQESAVEREKPFFPPASTTGMELLTLSQYTENW
jgi:hypothetical protein